MLLSHDENLKIFFSQLIFFLHTKFVIYLFCSKMKGKLYGYSKQ